VKTQADLEALVRGVVSAVVGKETFAPERPPADGAAALAATVGTRPGVIRPSAGGGGLFTSVEDAVRAASQAQRRFASEPLERRQTYIDAMRRAGELIAVRKPGSIEWLYPAWQFDAWKPRRGVARIVSAAREAGLDEARLYDLLTAPLGLRRVGRRRLVDLLLEGREDEVVEAVRAG